MHLLRVALSYALRLPTTVRVVRNALDSIVLTTSIFHRFATRTNQSTALLHVTQQQHVYECKQAHTHALHTRALFRPDIERNEKKNCNNHECSSLTSISINWAYFIDSDWLQNQIDGRKTIARNNLPLECRKSIFELCVGTVYRGLLNSLVRCLCMDSPFTAKENTILSICM